MSASIASEVGSNVPDMTTDTIMTSASGMLFVELFGEQRAQEIHELIESATGRPCPCRTGGTCLPPRADQ